MKTTVKICRIYDEILNEERTDVLFDANGKQYLGALFFEKEKYEKVKAVLEEAVLDTDVGTIMLTAYEMMKRFGRIAEDDKTFKTMVHWQFMNGFSDDMLSAFKAYSYKTDTELFEAIGR